MSKSVSRSVSKSAHAQQAIRSSGRPILNRNPALRVGDEAMGATVKGKPGPDETCLGEFAQVGVGKAAMIVHTEIEFDLTGNRAGDFERTALAIYEVIDRLLAAVDRIDRAAPASA